MDLGGVELFSGAATSPSKDQVDDDEEGYMMDIEDDLDKMEDAFEMVQHQKSADDAEDCEDEKEGVGKCRVRKACAGTLASATAGKTCGASAGMLSYRLRSAGEGTRANGRLCKTP